MGMRYLWINTEFSDFEVLANAPTNTAYWNLWTILSVYFHGQNDLNVYVLQSTTKFKVFFNICSLGKIKKASQNWRGK